MDRPNKGKTPEEENGGKPSKKSESKDIADQNPPPDSAPVLPQEFKTSLDRKNFAGEFLVKSWNLSEYSSPRDHYNLIIPSKDLDRNGFLTEERKQQERWDLEVPLFVAFLGSFTVYLRKRSQSTHLLSAWNRIKRMYKLEKGVGLELWAFRNTESSLPAFAIVITDHAKLQEQMYAREIPEEVRSRIMNFGNASEEAEMVYVAKKDLVKSDLLAGPGLKIRQIDMETDGLGTEMGQLPLDKITLIGPSLSEVLVRVRTRSGLQFYGADWKKFADSNNLQEGMRVRLWFFRKPTSSSSARRSILGFAIAFP